VHAAGRRAGQALPRSRAEAHGGALAHRAGIVVPAIVIGIEELFEPLQKLEIVLEPTLDQFINGYYLKVRWARNMQTGERACGETKCNGNKIRVHKNTQYGFQGNRALWQAKAPEPILRIYVKL